MSDQDQPETPDTTTDSARDAAPGSGPHSGPDSGPDSGPAPGTAAPVKKTTRPRKKAAAKPPAEAPGAEGADTAEPPAGDTPAPAKKATRPRKKAAAKPPVEETASPTTASAPEEGDGSGAPMVLFQAPAKPTTTTRTRTRKAPAKKAAASAEEPAETSAETPAVEDSQDAAPATKPKKSGAKGAKKKAAAAEETAALAEATTDAGTDVGTDSDAPKPKKKAAAKKPKKAVAEQSGAGADEATENVSESSADESTEVGDASPDDQQGEQQGEGGARRRSRRRGGRRRRKGSGAGEDTDRDESAESTGAAEDDTSAEGESEEGGEGSSKRRRTRTRTPKSPEDEIASVSGSTRLEAKKQRRREGREAGRRRAPIVSEAEFLARREAVDRVMVIRQRGDLTQIAVLEDKVLVEHYVSRESQTSLIGNVYLGRVQNVLPSMEAAFIDIGKGRNAVLYAGEVNWSGLGHKEGEPRKIESVLQSGQTVLVQVTKDPIGHKGARLTGQVSLPGRFLVYVPDGTTSGISRKLPDTERNRLKTLLKQIVPESAGVIVRTAAEGASEDELTQDVERLTARWQDIEAKVQAGRAPELLYGEPDLTLKVVRDLFTEDFSKLVVEGDDAWDLVDGYVAHVAPDLRERLERYGAGEDSHDGQDARDVFAAYRIDEQIAKALDRKVWLPSGGSLIIDRTEAMTVVDVNTGKFTGSGGNLEETVTKNNLEAAEEMVRQLRLRDIGGIIVIDFIDMVLESNRDLVLRRLVECLGRDRTRHQVAEVTSLGLVQMTRKRIGTGLLEAFSEECTHCKGRGLVLHDHPIETAGSSATAEDEPRRRRGGRSGRGGRNGNGDGAAEAKAERVPPSPKDLAAIRPQPPTSEDGDASADVPGEDSSGTTGAPPSADTSAQNGAAQENAPEVEPSPVEASDAAQVEDSTQDAPETGEEAAVEIPAAPAAPVVVTTTRRRRTATRPAGPPADAEKKASEDEPGEAPSAEPAAEEETLDEAGQLSHVPVKKKGSRKR